jgi:hypothetical protein
LFQYKKENPWDFEAFKTLVSDYSDIAASVCPSPHQSYDNFDASEILFLIKFAHFYVTLSQNSSKPASFDPRAWIIVANKKRFTNADRNMLNNCLSELGVNVNRATIDGAMRNAPCYTYPFRAYAAIALFNTSFEPFPVGQSISVTLVLSSNSAKSISKEDLRHVDQAIVQRSNPESLVEWFGERRLKYSSIAQYRLAAMLHTDQPKLFNPVYP